MRYQGVIANIQPQFVPSDSRWAQEKLPDSLLPYAYAWKTLLREGVHCAGGSDAPIELPNPLVGLHCAIYRPSGATSASPPADPVPLTDDDTSTPADAVVQHGAKRQRLDGSAAVNDQGGVSAGAPGAVMAPSAVPEPWKPDECLTREEALDLYTVGLMSCAYSLSLSTHCAHFTNIIIAYSVTYE